MNLKKKIINLLFAYECENSCVREIIESVFSVIKKKHNSYLRSKNQISRDVEMLLKCLVYNLCLIGRTINTGQF